MIRLALITSMAAMAVVSSVHAADVPRQCTMADYKTPVPADDGDVAAHRTFSLPTLIYAKDSSARVYGFALDLRVDASGNIVCQGARLADAETTAQRTALLNALPQWHYRPFLLAGHPSEVMLTEDIVEELRPARHIPMPSGGLSATKITLSGFGYVIALKGNGEGIYTDFNTDDGQPVMHDFNISPGEMAALIERLRAADAWSMARTYIRRFPDATGNNRLRIEISGQTKTIDFLNEDRAGMPASMMLAIAEIRQLGQFDRWFHYPRVMLPPIPAPPIPVPPMPAK